MAGLSCFGGWRVRNCRHSREERCNLRPSLLADLLQLRGIEHPRAENLVTPVPGVVAAATLVTVLLTGLNVQRLSEDLAVLHVALIDALEQSHVVEVQR